MSPVKKVIGSDFELSNTFERSGERDGDGERAAQALLAEIPGLPRQQYLSGTAVEYGRRFLREFGGSAYIDCDHLEINLPEHTGSDQHGLLIHAGLRLARRAQVAVARQLRPGTRLNVLANCGDGRQSWGAHLNMLLAHDTFLDLHYRKPHLAGFFATHLVTSTLYTGQGQVGPANDRESCDFQLSQRADWFEEFSGQQTTQNRPLLNLRAEHHAADGLAREHIIYLDFVFNPIANLLRAGTCQLVLAMIEAGWADGALQLDDCVGAASAVSRDLGLKKRLTTAVRCRPMSALEIQQALANLAGEFVASGEAGDAVPHADKIVATWLETLQLLKERDVDRLAQRCDAWLKYLLLDRQRARKGLGWRSPQLKALDLMFASLDPDEGLFFQMARAGFVEGMPSDEEIDRALSEPPTDTRAYLRTHLLRLHGAAVSHMDWSYIDFRVRTSTHWWTGARLSLPDPRAFGRGQSEPILNGCQSLSEIVEAVNTIV